MRFNTLILLFGFVFSYNAVSQEVKGRSKPQSLNISKIEDGKIPKLEITKLFFKDNDLNNRLDANENAFIKFNLVNSGDGRARNLKLNVKQVSNFDGIELNYTRDLSNLNAGESKEIVVSVRSNMKLETGLVKVNIYISEANGFSKYKNNPKQLQFPSLEFKSPEVRIVDQTFSLPKGGKLAKGELVDLTLQLQNIGQGKATDVVLSFTLNENVLAIKGKEFPISILRPGESKTCLLQFIANEEYDKTEIDIYYHISEYYNKYGDNGVISTSLNAELKETPTIIAGKEWQETEIITAHLSSLVDKNIPTNSKVNNRFALVIGNEDYQSKQTTLSSEQNVDYAVNDATIFKKYCLNTLGVKEENMFSIINATAGEMSQEIDLITKLVKRNGKKSELIVYYAGHGYPDELTKVPYLIPVDVSATNLRAAIKLSEMYDKLSSTGAKKVTVFLDACFTGGGRTSGLVASRGVKVKPKEGSLNGNLVVFSASSGEQSALPYHKEGHGMFTYFLLKKLQESKGRLSFSELETYLSDNVSITSLKENRKEQDPKVNTSSKVVNDWRNWKF
jgi:hypothetical protein